jgi:hypothetical protein
MNLRINPIYSMGFEIFLENLKGSIKSLSPLLVIHA